MAEACRRRGYAYQVLTDHTQSLAIASGLAPDRVEEQRAIIAELNARFAAGGARRDRAARDAAGGLPAAPRLRARGPGRRGARLRRRAARPVRRRRRVGPRLAPPAAGRADPADAERDPQPPRRHHRPPVGPDDPDPRRPRPRLGRGLRRGGRDRDGARDERLAAPPGPLGRARPPGGRGRLHPDDRLRRAQHARARLRALGRLAGAAGWVDGGERPQHPVAGGPARVGRRASPARIGRRSGRSPRRRSSGLVRPAALPSAP